MNPNKTTLNRVVPNVFQISFRSFQIQTILLNKSFILLAIVQNLSKKFSIFIFPRFCNKGNKRCSQFWKRTISDFQSVTLQKKNKCTKVDAENFTKIFSGFSLFDTTNLPISKIQRKRKSKFFLQSQNPKYFQRLQPCFLQFSVDIRLQFFTPTGPYQNDQKSTKISTKARIIFECHLQKTHFQQTDLIIRHQMIENNISMIFQSEWNFKRKEKFSFAIQKKSCFHFFRNGVCFYQKTCIFKMIFFHSTLKGFEPFEILPSEHNVWRKKKREKETDWICFGKKWKTKKQKCQKIYFLASQYKIL